MKGTLTEAERDRLIAEANARDAWNRRHAWYVRVTEPNRKALLRVVVGRLCRGEPMPSLAGL